MSQLYPTTVIELPSKGWFYPETHPLSKGTVEIYYMSAKHEDILTSRNLIQRGVVIDKLVESLIAEKDIKLDDLLLGDKNALVIASRILGYGKSYTVSIQCPKCSSISTHDINLEELKDKDIEFLPENKGRNLFQYQLPTSKDLIEFKLLTHKDEKIIDGELSAVKKIGSEITREVTTRMKRSVVSINGNTDTTTVRNYVDNMLAVDARAFRDYAAKVSPDINVTFEYVCTSCGYSKENMEVPIDSNFFWPDSRQ